MKKKIGQIARDFKKKMQKIVDDDDGITGISIEIKGEKYTIAEKKKK